MTAPRHPAEPEVPIPAPLARGADGAVRVPPERVASGRLTPPPSKSLTHRAFNLALLAARPLVVEHPLDAEDTRLFRAALATLGFRVEEHPAEGDRPAEVHLAPGGRPASAEIHCGNAGTLFRFLVASLAALPGDWRLDGVPRLRERPVGPLVEALRRLGAAIRSDATDGYAPLVIAGRTLPGGSTFLDAGSSSQFLSAVLMASLVAEGAVEVEVPVLTSAPYVDLTLDLVGGFGGHVEQERLPTGGARYRVRPGLTPPERWRVEADLSAVAYPAAAAALTGGRVALEGVREATRQGDRLLLDLLRRMGAAVEWRQGLLEVRGPADALRALTVDMSEIPDQVPTLAALAPFAEGVTRIENVPHLRIKESDRLAAMAAELTRAGATVEELEDGLVIPGVWAHRAPPEPASPIRIETHGDHRIAMALALTALRRPGLEIHRPEVVAKSYPGFWRDFAGLLDG